MNESNADKKLDELYPKHFQQALSNAGLLKDFDIPTLGEKKESIERSQNDPTTAALKKRRERDRKRAIYFKTAYCNFRTVPIHAIIRKIKKRFPSLTWLRVSMSYSRHANLRRELFQGDLNAKLNKNLLSADFMDRPCNCKDPDLCPFRGKCRKKIVELYEGKCLNSDKRYRGNTQQFVKIRTQQHVRDVKNLVQYNQRSDAFAYHFAKYVPRSNLTRKEMTQCIRVEVKTIWQGDPLSCVRTFGTKSCKLCFRMKRFFCIYLGMQCRTHSLVGKHILGESCKLCFREKIAILELIRKHPFKAINVLNEIHGACRHKPRFHRFIKRNMYSTDESSEDENRPSSTTSTDSSEFDFIDIDETRQAEPDDPKDILCPANFLETRAQGNLARSRILDPPTPVQVESNLNEETAEDADPLDDTP
eukprot:CAMPEP_0194068284 /NCGR_PEP_ID=MMETSP0009_2-20130614/87012_1 /TAXON_ID=210454 /ORGANISM="Grammatophora oceanica, Strain CCMP 410" /LENGTH=418 /DNA_ID=CAMNT_0038721369 /DNA_START=43 /DNA_END=1297 /DNA_ORIENTATION=-